MVSKICMKKCVAIVAAAGFALWSSLAAYGGSPNEITLGDVIHSLSVNPNPKTGISYAVEDAFSPSQGPIKKATLSANFNEAKTLKSLVLHLEVETGFSPSGEIVIRFASDKSLSFYCIPILRSSNAGKTIFQLTFLGDLSKLHPPSGSTFGGPVELEVFSKKASSTILTLPKVFFEMLVLQDR